MVVEGVMEPIAADHREQESKTCRGETVVGGIAGGVLVVAVIVVADE